MTGVRANIEWAGDGETLVFNALKTPEVISACQSLALLTGTAYPRVGIDLTNVTSAFSPQALQLVVLAIDLHSRGIEVALALPEERRTRDLFINTGWAHLIDPAQFPESDFLGKHLPATRYASASEQSEVVTQAFRRLAGRLSLPNNMQYALEWALNEATDNVLTHAESSAGGIVQVTHYRNRVHLVVADAGIGIAQSMRGGFPELTDDVEAVKEALKPGVTSGKGQGNGLAGMMSIAQDGHGEVTVVSSKCFGHAEFGHNGGARSNEKWLPMIGNVTFPGTVVTLGLDTSSPVNIRKALSFQNPGTGWEPGHNPFDISHADPSQEGVFEMNILDEDVGYRSREAGRILRTTALNILSTEDCRHLDINFSGIPIVASSFADEFVGKMILQLGIIEFMGKVKLKGMTEEVKTVLDGAVSQRLRAISEQGT